MQLRIASTDFYLDGLILETILETFRARELATLSGVCRALRSPAQLAAHRALLAIVQHMQSSLLRHCERGSWIHQLGEWEAVMAANVIWLQADAEHCSLVKQGDLKLVKRASDLSGSGNGAHMGQRMPVLRPDSINGHAAFEFDGAAVLKTRPFTQPLPQPITLMVVARARGDTTIVDSLGPECVPSALWIPGGVHASHLHADSPMGPVSVRRRLRWDACALHAFLAHSSAHIALVRCGSRRSGRFELCHGYPSGWHPSPEICMTASGQDASPRQSLRGTTRGTGEWHIYTAVFDHKKSEIFCDGYCEASGKTAGANSLDGLSIGCDHNGVFFLTGSITELRLFSCHLPAAQRVQTEAALAHRYGITYSSQPAPPTDRARSLSRFSCAPRSLTGARTSAAAASSELAN